MERLNESHESHMKRLSDTHREKVALLDRQFLQQKQQLMRAREAALWEMEERQLHERHQLAKRQLKDMFFLQRHQMLVHHEKATPSTPRARGRGQLAQAPRPDLALAPMNSASTSQARCSIPIRAAEGSQPHRIALPTGTTWPLQRAWRPCEC